MFLQVMDINGESTVSEIVNSDYRTADVFRKYGIEYCCGARWPLSTVCVMNGVDQGKLIDDLRKATRPFHLPASIQFEKWSVDFITGYIVNVHHSYLSDTLPTLDDSLSHFVNEHSKKYPTLDKLQIQYTRLQKELFSHIRQEEDVVFPYMRQISRAHIDNDSLGSLLVRTLRKSITQIIQLEKEMFREYLSKLRQLTDNYNPPEKACTSHRVVYAKLKELDTDLAQHLYLQTEVLYPRIMVMEDELVGQKQA